MVTEDIYSDYFEYLISGNKQECQKITQRLIEDKSDIKNLYLNLFQRSMYQIGDLWENNKISVAVEHLATSITESLLNLVYPLIFSAHHIGKSTIVVCVPNEYHQIGAKMVADIFEMNGWDGYFLGANTPSTELLKLIDEKKPDLLSLSMSLYFSIGNLEEMVQKVIASFPNLDIIVGGQGFLWGGLDVIQKYSQVQFIESINKLEQVIKNY